MNVLMSFVMVVYAPLDGRSMLVVTFSFFSITLKQCEKILLLCADFVEHTTFRHLTNKFYNAPNGNNRNNRLFHCTPSVCVCVIALSFTFPNS